METEQDIPAPLKPRAGEIIGRGRQKQAPEITKDTEQISPGKELARREFLSN